MNDKIRQHEIVSNHTFHFGPFTVVSLEEKSGIKSYGWSRKSNSDKPNDEIGANIAKGRAEKSMFLKKAHRKIRSLFMG